MQAPSPSTGDFSEDDARAIVRELRQTPEFLASLFASASEEALQHRPDDGWSAVEIVWHLADHDAFERSRRFEAILTEENPTLPDDETRFRVAEANDQALAAAEALAFFQRERKLVLALLERLGPREWQRTGIHPHDGVRTLLQVADLRGHDREHCQQATAAIADAAA
jgi:hypothetical protein